MTDETDATWLTLAAAARNVLVFLEFESRGQDATPASNPISVLDPTRGERELDSIAGVSAISTPPRELENKKATPEAIGENAPEVEVSVAVGVRTELEKVRGLSCIGTPREPTVGCDRPFMRRDAGQALEISAPAPAALGAITGAGAFFGETERNAELELAVIARASSLARRTPRD